MKKQKTDDMRAEYDFSHGERGKFYRPDAALSIIRLEPDVLEFYLARSKQEGRDYADLINEDLRRMMSESRPENLKGLIRNIVAEEIEKYKIASKPKRQKAA